MCCGGRRQTVDVYHEQRLFPCASPFPNSLIMFPIQSGLLHPLWIKTIFDFVCSVPSVNVHKSEALCLILLINTKVFNISSAPPRLRAFRDQAVFNTPTPPSQKPLSLCSLSPYLSLSPPLFPVDRVCAAISGCLRGPRCVTYLTRGSFS